MSARPMGDAADTIAVPSEGRMSAMRYLCTLPVRTYSTSTVRPSTTVSGKLVLGDDACSAHQLLEAFDLRGNDLQVLVDLGDLLGAGRHERPRFAEQLGEIAIADGAQLLELARAGSALWGRRRRLRSLLRLGGVH